MPVPDELLEFDPLASRQGSPLFPQDAHRKHHELRFGSPSSQPPAPDVIPLTGSQTSSDPLDSHDLLQSLPADVDHVSLEQPSSRPEHVDRSPAHSRDVADARRDQLLEELSLAEQDSWKDLSSTEGLQDQPYHHYAKQPRPPRRLSGIMDHTSKDATSIHEQVPSRSPPANPAFSPSSSETFHPSSPKHSVQSGPLVDAPISESTSAAGLRNPKSLPHMRSSSYFPIVGFSNQSQSSDATVAPFSSPSYRPSQTLPSSPSRIFDTNPLLSSSSSSSQAHRNFSSSSSHSTLVSTPSSSNHTSHDKHTPIQTSHPYIPPSGAPGYTGESRDWNKSRFEYDATKDSLGSQIKFLGVNPGLPTTLDEDLADAIRPSLPPRVRVARSWTLLYSLDQHGVSLSTLYARVGNGMGKSRSTAGCLLVVKDSEGDVFGAYCNEAFKKSDVYYGSGECFLWKSVPFASTDVRVGTSVRTYKWTGKNDYMVLSDSSFISIGGGDGKFGLWMDSELEHGVSSRCPAFHNEILCKQSGHRGGPGGRDEGRFNILNVEVWGIGV